MATHTNRSGRLGELIPDDAQDSAMQIADAYARRGDREKAFQSLESAYAQRDGGMSDLAFDPLLVSLHADPRCAAAPDWFAAVGVALFTARPVAA